MIEFGYNKIHSIRTYCITALTELYGKEEAIAITHELFDHFTGLRRSELEKRADDPLNESTIVDFVHALKRLKKHEPLQYVISKAWFRNLELYVNKDVLIPRPETEELVELVIHETDIATRPLRILDACTGSGCIAISLKSEYPYVTLDAIDLSDGALKVASRNADHLNVPVNFIKEDILAENRNTFAPGTFDVIVSNPPYVLRSEYSSMSLHVRDHEPGMALFVEDSDPLLFYRAIMSKAITWLKKDGHVFFEINPFLADEMLIMAKSYNFNSRIVKDMSGKDRFLAATFQK